MNKELIEVGKLVGIFNPYKEELQRGVDWYADAMKDIYIVSSDFNEEDYCKIIILRRCALTIKLT